MTTLCPVCGSRNYIAAPTTSADTVVCQGYARQSHLVQCEYRYRLDVAVPDAHRRYFLTRVAYFGWERA